jgi:ZIP family zinc transporter
MIYKLFNFNYLLLSFFAGIFTWFITLIGSSFVFLNRRPNRKLFDCMLGFAGGVMISASFFSLLIPSIEYSKNLNIPFLIPVSTGFLLGSFFLLLLDKFIPHLHPNFQIYEKEGIKKELPLYFLLVLAITIHNIPEGLAVGVSFGTLKYNKNYEIFLGALSLAFGIGVQNFPEGLAVSMPLSASGMSKRKSFFYGQLSGIVEPVFSVIGAYLVSIFSKVLPYALSFAAGAMVYVVVEEVIPETQKEKNTDISTISFIFGLLFMLLLDNLF